MRRFIHGRSFGIWVALVTVVLSGLVLDRGFELMYRDFGTGDFLGYWSVSRALLHGPAMYDPVWLEALQRAHGFPGYSFHDFSYATMPLWNPPPLVALLLPLGSLHFSLATYLWSLLTLLLFGHATLFFNSRLASPLPAVFALGLALLGVSGGVAAYWGQPTPFLTACLIYAWQAQRMDRPVATGLLMLPILLKPHLFVVSLTMLGIRAIRGRQWRTPLILIAVLLMLIAMLTILDPRWLDGWRSQGISGATTVSLWDIATYFAALPVSFQLLALPLGALVGIVRYWNVEVVTSQVLAEATLLSVLFSPYLLKHDIIVLLPAVLWLSARLWLPGWRFALLLPMVLLTVPITSLLITSPVLAGLLEGNSAIARLANDFAFQDAFQFFLALALYLLFWCYAVNRSSTVAQRERAAISGA